MAKTSPVKALESKLKRLERELAILKDVHAIRRLQHAYGYYLDKCLYDDVVELFTDDCTVHFMGGLFRGKKSAHRLYCDRFRKNFTGGKNGPVFGFLLDHLMMQDIVDVAPDRKTAQARLRVFMQAGRHESAGGQQRQWWEGALYENTYAREKGVWKIKVLNYRPVWHADFDSGWAKTRPNYVPFYTKAFPEDPIGPDELQVPKPVLWPDTDVLEFHYPHPVTGKWPAK
ncbi:MAG TPA: nuclear transport factor 2 family protein [Steroidobacteraceae bacterium]|nr:nuclear transport factor 2 family protein [Steroidobacteraceae bacterium]